MAITSASSSPRKSRLRRALLWLLLTLGVLILALAVAYNLLKYKPTLDARTFMQSTDQVTVTQAKHWIAYEPVDKVGKTTVLFYPGGLVEPESYAPLGLSLAERGYRTYIVKMPLELAVLAPNRATEIVDLAPGERYVLGGHSLGGAMAARYAAEHEGALEGVFFMGAYADPKADLSGADLQALQITASEDQILNREAWEAGRGRMPADTRYVEIEGGNHGQFGAYGQQKGDGAPRISGEEQLHQTVDALSDWLAQLQAPAS